MNQHEASTDTRLSPHPPCGTFTRRFVQGLVALGLIALGALGATLMSRQTGSLPPIPVTTAPPPSPAAPQAVPTPDIDVELMLTPEAVQQAGIKTAEVTTVASQTIVQLPGSVMADAYREVQVVRKQARVAPLPARACSELTRQANEIPHDSLENDPPFFRCRQGRVAIDT